MYDFRLVRDLEDSHGRALLDLDVYHALHSSKWSAHLWDIPGLGGSTMVHALDEVPPVRAAVEDARGFLLVARVEASMRTEGIVHSTRPVSVIILGIEGRLTLRGASLRRLVWRQKR